MQRLEQLRSRKQPAADGVDADVLALAAQQPKRRRVLDVLQEQLGGSSSDEDDGEGSDDGLVLDWRAKTV
jgi:hypothetical protein